VFGSIFRRGGEGKGGEQIFLKFDCIAIIILKLISNLSINLATTLLLLGYLILITIIIIIILLYFFLGNNFYYYIIYTSYLLHLKPLILLLCWCQRPYYYYYLILIQIIIGCWSFFLNVNSPVHVLLWKIYEAVCDKIGSLDVCLSLVGLWNCKIK